MNARCQVDDVGVASYNVRGLGGRESKLESHLLQDRIHFACLQETHTSPGYLAPFSSMVAVVQHGNNGQRGMAILYHPAFAGHVTQVKPDMDHVQILHVGMGDVNLVIVNVYLPSAPPSTIAYNLSEEIEGLTRRYGTDCVVVVAGDFNVNIARPRGSPAARVLSTTFDSLGFAAASPRGPGFSTYTSLCRRRYQSLIDFIQVRGSGKIRDQTARFVNDLTEDPEEEKDDPDQGSDARAEPGATKSQTSKKARQKKCNSDHKMLTVRVGIDAMLDATWVHRIRLEDLEHKQDEYVEALQHAVDDREPERQRLLTRARAGASAQDTAIALWDSLLVCFRRAMEECLGASTYLRVGAGLRPPLAIRALLQRQTSLDDKLRLQQCTTGQYDAERAQILAAFVAESEAHTKGVWFGDPGDPVDKAAWRTYKDAQRRDQATPTHRSQADLESTAAAHAEKFADFVEVQRGEEEWVRQVDQLADELKTVHPDDVSLHAGVAAAWEALCPGYAEDADEKQNDKEPPDAARQQTAIPSVERFHKYVKAIDPSTAHGKDQIPGAAVKAGGAVAAKLLHDCYADLFALGVSPEALSEVVVTYILKHGRGDPPFGMADPDQSPVLASPARSYCEPCVTTPKRQSEAASRAHSLQKPNCPGRKWPFSCLHASSKSGPAWQPTWHSLTSREPTTQCGRTGCG